MSYRNTKFLDRNHVIYRRDPISDHPDEVHDWGTVYYNGTHECYDLFRTKAKIHATLNQFRAQVMLAHQKRHMHHLIT